MKKILILIFVGLILFILIDKEKMIVVPDESIRFRVIAASNNEKDIKVKEKVVENISSKLSEIFTSVSIDKSRKKVNNNIKNLKKIIDDTFKELNYQKKYNVNYGINYFPEKKYKGIKYNSGYYESLVITIAEGKGDNFWCVMFPPLCMIDESVDKKDYDYKLKVLEVINNKQ